MEPTAKEVAADDKIPFAISARRNR